MQKEENVEDNLETTKSVFLIKRPNIITDKAKFYLDKYPNVNEAFSHAKTEDRVTLESIYRQGVDINYDLDAPNKMNMFNWSITAHEVCSPYFLEAMFNYGRKDIATDGQKVFEFACRFGDSRHIAIFMKYRDTYKIDIFQGMRSAVSGRNRDNLHYLTLYKRLSKEEVSILWDLACGFSCTVPVLLYMSEWIGCIVTKEKLIEHIPTLFFESFSVFVSLYLFSKEEPFEIEKDLVDKIIKGTDDRILKLHFLEGAGFKVENFEEIVGTPEKDLPKASCSRYCTLSY